jgi:hypothetical protein
LISLSPSQILSVAGTKQDIVDLNKTSSQDVSFPLKNCKTTIEVKDETEC